MTYLSSLNHATIIRLTQQALSRGLNRDLDEAQELLLYAFNMLKHLYGDYSLTRGSTHEQDFTVAEAWGQYELAAGIVKLARERPGSSLVHLKRAWQIWRWQSLHSRTQEQRHTARRERIRASLWLGEAWSRLVSDRALQSTNAILRAALIELEKLQDNELLQETIAQQRLLPAAPAGSPAQQQQNSPYLYTFIHQRT